MAAMKRMTPYQRFSSDPRPLQLPENEPDLRRRFVVCFERTMTNDHVVKIDGARYEMPLGYPDKKVLIYHRLLDDTFAVLHDGKLVDIHVADLVANARERRSAKLHASSTDTDTDPKPLPKSAADLAFDHDFGPALGPDGHAAQDKKER